MLTFDRLLETGHYSDFEIRTPKKTFHVHKGVVCVQSSYFRALVNNNFLVGDITTRYNSFTDRSKEGQVGYVLLNEEAEVMENVLAFMYHSTDITKTNGYYSLGSKNPVLDAKLFTAADKYDLQDLRAICLYNLAAIEQFFRKGATFINTVEYVYGNEDGCPQELYNLVICAGHQHEDTHLSALIPFGDRLNYCKMLDKYPDFTRDILVRCQPRKQILCSWNGKPARIGDCLNGDKHFCEGICGDIDVNLLVCKCGLNHQVACLRCRGTGRTRLGQQTCGRCEGGGIEGRIDPRNTAHVHYCYGA